MNLNTLITQSDLPPAATSLIRDVVRHTRLWQSEKLDIASELIAHFHDGLASGKSIDDLIRAFGDIRATARLIRRAKKRNRSILWKLFVRSSQAFACFLILYILAGILLYLDHPNPTVDYLARINAAALALPESDRAWPIYRHAMIQSDFFNLKLDVLEVRNDTQGRIASHDVRPTDPQWPAAVAFLHTHADLLAAIRYGASKPGLGLTVSQDETIWSDEDRLALFGPQDTPPQPFVPADHFDELTHGLLTGVLLPHLFPMRNMVRLLTADITLAAHQGDSQRILDDAVAILGLCWQVQEQPFLANQHSALAISNFMVDRIGQVLKDNPDLFTDSQLSQLAHLLATLDYWRSPDFTAENWHLNDVFQRIYGHAGRVTNLSILQPSCILLSSEDSRVPVFNGVTVVALTPIVAAWFAPRDQMLAQHSRLMNFANQDSRRSLRDLYLVPSRVQQQLTEWKSSFVTGLRYSILVIAMPPLERSDPIVRQGYFARLALQIALAAELYNRDTGSYPSNIDALVPQYLPQIPIDESATSGNLILKIIDSRPIVYGRGLDDDDDGGTPPENYHWPALDTRVHPDAPIPDGDWILYPPPFPDQPKN